MAVPTDPPDAIEPASLQEREAQEGAPTSILHPEESKSPHERQFSLESINISKRVLFLQPLLSLTVAVVLAVTLGLVPFLRISEIYLPPPNSTSSSRVVLSNPKLVSLLNPSERFPGQIALGLDDDYVTMSAGQTGSLLTATPVVHVAALALSTLQALSNVALVLRGLRDSNKHRLGLRIRRILLGRPLITAIVALLAWLNWVLLTATILSDMALCVFVSQTYAMFASNPPVAQYQVVVGTEFLIALAIATLLNFALYCVTRSTLEPNFDPRYRAMLASEPYINRIDKHDNVGWLPKGRRFLQSKMPKVPKVPKMPFEMVAIMGHAVRVLIRLVMWLPLAGSFLLAASTLFLVTVIAQPSSAAALQIDGQPYSYRNVLYPTDLTTARTLDISFITNLDDINRDRNRIIATAGLGLLLAIWLLMRWVLSNSSSLRRKVRFLGLSTKSRAKLLIIEIVFFLLLLISAAATAGSSAIHWAILGRLINESNHQNGNVAIYSYVSFSYTLFGVIGYALAMGQSTITALVVYNKHRQFKREHAKQEPDGGSDQQQSPGLCGILRAGILATAKTAKAASIRAPMILTIVFGGIGIVAYMLLALFDFERFRLAQMMNGEQYHDVYLFQTCPLSNEWGTINATCVTNKLDFTLGGPLQRGAVALPLIILLAASLQHLPINTADSEVQSAQREVTKKRSRLYVQIFLATLATVALFITFIAYTRAYRDPSALIPPGAIATPDTSPTSTPGPTGSDSFPAPTDTAPPIVPAPTPETTSVPGSRGANLVTSALESISIPPEEWSSWTGLNIMTSALNTFPTSTTLAVVRRNPPTTPASLLRRSETAVDVTPNIPFVIFNVIAFAASILCLFSGIAAVIIDWKRVKKGQAVSDSQQQWTGEQEFGRVVDEARVLLDRVSSPRRDRKQPKTDEKQAKDIQDHIAAAWLERRGIERQDAARSNSNAAESPVLEGDGSQPAKFSITKWYADRKSRQKRKEEHKAGKKQTSERLRAEQAELSREPEETQGQNKLGAAADAARPSANGLVQEGAAPSSPNPRVLTREQSEAREARKAAQAQADQDFEQSTIDKNDMVNKFLRNRRETGDAESSAAGAARGAQDESK